MKDEEQQLPKGSRRARRRAQGEGQGVAAPPMEEASETESAPAETESEEKPATATEEIREENRRARRAAAAKRRAKRERERKQSVEVGLGAGEMVDDALARSTDVATRWLRRHFNIAQWVIVLGIAGWIGWEIYTWRTNKTVAQASDSLMAGVDAQRGRVGESLEKGERDERGYLDPREVFATREAKLKAAAEAYEKASQSRPDSTTGQLAKLGLAGVCYDQGKYDDAIRLYEEVAKSSLAAESPDAKGRALEGIGLALEAKKQPDAALKKFQELENADLQGFGDLARFHQARLLHEKKDDGAAKEKLVKLIEKETKKRTATERPSYLERSARELLTEIDPAAVPKESSEDALKRAIEEFQQKLPEGTNVPVIPTQLPSSPSP